MMLIIQLLNDDDNQRGDLETEKPTKATNEVPFLKKTSAPALGSLSPLLGMPKSLSSVSY